VTIAHGESVVQILCVKILGVEKALHLTIVLPDIEQILKPDRLPRLHHAQPRFDMGEDLVCPRIASTDLDDLTCKAIDGQELSRRGPDGCGIELAFLCA
jgi:hypothetical protein